MAMMLKCSCGRSVVVHARPASGRVPCPICSREILVPSSSEPARADSSNAQRLSAPPPLPAQSRTVARPPPLPAVLTPMSPAAAVAGKAIDAGDPARESTSRFSVSTILIALNLALIAALGGYAVLGDWRRRPLPVKGLLRNLSRCRMKVEPFSPVTLPAGGSCQSRFPSPRPGLLLRGPAPAEPGSLTTREIVARTEASVALIKGRLGSGSGFLARPGVVITNAHVIELELLSALEVHFPSAAEGAKGPYPARLLDKDPRRRPCHSRRGN